MKIVLVRLDRIGDLLVSTPAIATIRRSFPQADITLVCSPRNQVAVEGNPDLTTRIVVGTRQEFYRTAWRLRGADLAIALAPRTQDICFVGLTQAHKRVGYTYTRRLMTRMFAHVLLHQHVYSDADPGLSERFPDRPVMHEVEQLLSVVQAAGAETISRDLVLNLRDEDRDAVAHYPAQGIHVHLAPRWLRSGSSEESFGILLEELCIFGKPIIVSYAPECAEAAARLQQYASAFFVGDVSFHRWAALIERAACVVTVDTSATHVASALKRPTVVLFEERYFGLNSREWAPWNVPYVAVRKPIESTLPELAASRRQLVAAVGKVLGQGEMDDFKVTSRNSHDF